MTSSPNVGKGTPLLFAFGWTTQKMISTRGKTCWFSHRFPEHTKACLQFCPRNGAYHCHLPTGGCLAALTSKSLMSTPGMQHKCVCVSKQLWLFHVTALKVYKLWSPSSVVSYSNPPLFSTWTITWTLFVMASCLAVRVLMYPCVTLSQPLEMDFPGLSTGNAVFVFCFSFCLVFFFLTLYEWYLIKCKMRNMWTNSRGNLCYILFYVCNLSRFF